MRWVSYAFTAGACRQRWQKMANVPHVPNISKTDTFDCLHLKSQDSCNPWLSKLSDWEKKRLSIAACSEVGKPALLTPASAIAEQCQQLAILTVCRSFPTFPWLVACLPYDAMMPHVSNAQPMCNPCSTHVLSCCRMLSPCSLMHLWRCRWLDCCCLDRLTQIPQPQRICHVNESMT